MKQLSKDISKTILISLMIMVGLYFLLIIYFIFFYCLNHIITSEKIEIDIDLCEFLNYPFIDVYHTRDVIPRIFATLTLLTTIFLIMRQKLKS